MKPKVDPQTALQIEKLLKEFIQEDPRLKLSNDEESAQNTDSVFHEEDVVDIYRMRLKTSGPN